MLSGGLRTKGITKQSQENQPLITVVTVVRNGGETLEETNNLAKGISLLLKDIKNNVREYANSFNYKEILNKHIEMWNVERVYNNNYIELCAIFLEIFV